MSDCQFNYEVLPYHGVNGGYFAIEVLPAAWACLENMSRPAQDPASDFCNDPEYIANCKDLEFAVEESVFLYIGPLLFAREMFDPNHPANKLNRETEWDCCACGDEEESQFDPYGANFYSNTIGGPRGRVWRLRTSTNLQ